MTKAIYFDMDGTIADFYNVENWLEYLRKGRTKPYREARPIGNMRTLAKLIRQAQIKGYSAKVISWTAKQASTDFQTKIEKSKKAWLKRHLPSVEWDDIFIIPYGTPKENYATEETNILFDDDSTVREHWTGDSYSPDEIIKILKELI